MQNWWLFLLVDVALALALAYALYLYYSLRSELERLRTRRETDFTELSGMVRDLERLLASQANHTEGSPNKPSAGEAAASGDSSRSEHDPLDASGIPRQQSRKVIRLPNNSLNFRSKVLWLHRWGESSKSIAVTLGVEQEQVDAILNDRFDPRAG